MDGGMDLGLFRGLVTAALFFAFCGVVVWAYSRSRRRDFEEASRLPLEPDPPAHTDDESRKGAQHD
jgi:cytochrome c oxidase cbb3-type subunit 4